MLSVLGIVAVIVSVPSSASPNEASSFASCPGGVGAFTAVQPSQVTALGGLLGFGCRGRPNSHPATARAEVFSALAEAERTADGCLLEAVALLRLYGLTGESQHLDAAQTLWTDIAAHRMYLTGGVTVVDAQSADFGLLNTGPVCETCTALSWLWLTEALLEITGDPKYADVVERLLWNQLPAAQSFDGHDFRQHAAPNGARPAGYVGAPDCCSTSGARAMCFLRACIYAQGRDGIYVNQYCDSTAILKTPRGARLALDQHTTFPSADSVALRVRIPRDERFTIFVRIPAWSEDPSVRLFYYAARPATPGAYFKISRTWSAGDIVHLRFPMSPRWVQAEGGNPAMCALVRGPLIYALDTAQCTDDVRYKLLSGRDNGAAIEGLAAVLTCAPISPADGVTPADMLGPFYRVRCRATDGSVADATMVPFANLGSSPPDAPYATWLPAALPANNPAS